MDGETDARLTETQAQLRSIFPPLRVSIAVQQPVAVLLENGPAFSVLLALRLSSEPESDSMILQDCCQFRIDSENCRAVRKFTEVVIGFDSEKALYFASPDRGDTLFAQPSRAPYAVFELSRPEAEWVTDILEDRRNADLFNFYRKRFSQLLGFSSPNSDELHAPDDYASAQSEYSRQQTFI